MVTQKEVVTALYGEWVEDLIEEVKLAKDEIAEFSKIKEEYRENLLISELCKELITHCLENINKGMQEIEILRE